MYFNPHSTKFKLLFILTLIVLLSCIYHPIMHLGFANVDDKWMLLDDILVQSEIFNLDFVKAVFVEINSLQYAPLNLFYYYFIYQINGYDPHYYHLFSLFIHLLNVGLVYILLKKLLDIFAISNAIIIAYAVSLIWAVLPFNVESVVWISASKILLYTFWGNISFICFLYAYTRSNKAMYFASLLAFILSFLAKEQAVLYALMMFLFVYCYQLKFRPKVNLISVSIHTTPFMILALVFGLVTVYVAVYGDGEHAVERYPFVQRFILAFYCLYFYIFNCFIPINLHYHYPFPMRAGNALPIIYYIFPVVAVLMIRFGYQFLRNNKNLPIFIMGFGIFLIHLLLTIQVFPLARASMLADRYMYVSSIGLLLIGFLFLNETFDLSFKKLDRFNIILLTGFFLYVIGLSIYSYNLVHNWGNMQL